MQLISGLQNGEGNIGHLAKPRAEKHAMDVPRVK
jgi:hypothetical protein